MRCSSASQGSALLIKLRCFDLEYKSRAQEQSRTLRLIGLQVEMVEIFPGWSFLVILRVDRVESINLKININRFRMMENLKLHEISRQIREKTTLLC